MSQRQSTKRLSGTPNASILALAVGFSLITLLASPHAFAETRFWNLTGVHFDDGAIATGNFSYDDATAQIANWNVRVTESPRSNLSSGFTYVPGNSSAGTYQPPGSVFREFWFASTSGTPQRSLLIRPLVPLDGSNTTVALLQGDSFESWGSFFNQGGFLVYESYREVASGSLVVTSPPPPAAMVQVDEFYNPTLEHYFITASAAEKHDLDTGIHPGWRRTGESFKAFAAGSSAGGSINPVCRYYGNPLRGLDSHFYSADAGECVKLFRQNPVYWASEIDAVFQADWIYESDNVFQINLPNTESGACPDETVPVYRLWNQRADSNHRYTTSVAIKSEMLAAGYLAEGYGADGVVMCAAVQ